MIKIKSLGIIRKVDELGRLVIPKEVRNVLGLEEKTPVEMYMDNETVILKKYIPGCHCCNETEQLTEIMGLKLCPKCVDKFYKSKKQILNK